jgi:arylsulfatase A-like enzyme
VEQKPLDGRSLLGALLRDEGDDDPDRTQYFEMLGNRGIYRNGWFACKRQWNPLGFHAGPDYPDDGWELYDLRSDPAQSHDLAESHPDELERLRVAFDEEARRNEVYPLGAWNPWMGGIFSPAG